MGILDEFISSLWQTKKYYYSHYGYIPQTPPANGNGSNGEEPPSPPPSGGGNGDSYQTYGNDPIEKVMYTIEPILTSPSKETIETGQELLTTDFGKESGDGILFKEPVLPLFGNILTGFSGSRGRSAEMRAKHPPRGGKGGLL